LKAQTGITFEDKLIGSMSRKFVLVEKGTKNFDFDYNLVLQNEAGYDDPTELHEAFKDSLFYIRDEYNKHHPHNLMKVKPRKTVFTIIFSDDSSRYTCDLAIIGEECDEDDELHQYVVIYNKHQNEAIYNERRHVDFTDDIYYINDKGYNEDLKEEYLYLKNNNLNPNKKSFALFSEAINNVFTQMRNDGIDC